ncbi:MAG: hypothetical protein ACI85Z_000710 [Rheinheimera aquimaris]|jgi:hypothetical protein
MHVIFVRVTSWITGLNLLLYLLYAILLWSGNVGLPVADNNMSIEATAIGCLLLAAVPASLLWLSSRYDLLHVRDGYHKRSELLLSFFALICTLVMLRIYYLEIFPAL